MTFQTDELRFTDGTDEYFGIIEIEKYSTVYNAMLFMDRGPHEIQACDVYFDSYYDTRSKARQAIMRKARTMGLARIPDDQ